MRPDHCAPMIPLLPINDSYVISARWNEGAVIFTANSTGA
jgi:hypothetical protein